MLKMADACADASKQTRFHEMHVQRHNNVSILYADIVNFTPLSERLSASDLVKTLNELFGRFDQIAQVRFLKCLNECAQGCKRTIKEYTILTTLFFLLFVCLIVCLFVPAYL